MSEIAAARKFRTIDSYRAAMRGDKTLRQCIAEKCTVPTGKLAFRKKGGAK